MSELDSQSSDPQELDHSLAEIISDGIGITVHVVEPSETDAFLLAHPPESLDAITQQLALPAGRIAIWDAPEDEAARIAKHAQTLLDLEVARNESKQLLAEVESLTNQVMQDFEELSLIRTLASSLELPQSANDTDDFVLASLRPLASGVGAVALAAVLVDDSDDEKRRTIWTEQAILSDDDLSQLIDLYGERLTEQPLVRNRCVGDADCGANGLNELIMTRIARCRPSQFNHDPAAIGQFQTATKDLRG